MSIEKTFRAVVALAVAVLMVMASEYRDAAPIGPLAVDASAPSQPYP